MKTKIISIIALSLNLSFAKAQEIRLSIPSTVKATEYTYKITSGYNSNRVKYENVGDVIEIKSGDNDGDAQIEFNKKLIYSIFKKAFLQQIENEKFKNQVIAVDLILDRDGDFKKMKFDIEKSLAEIINLKDLEILEKEIKKQVHPKIIRFNDTAKYVGCIFIIKFNDLRNEEH